MKSARSTADRKITLIDVARLAGVSAITVSRAINQPGIVSENLRQRVQDAINALGYIPNQYASSLASSRSNVIGVVIPSLSNTVFTDVLRGIYDVTEAAGYKILLVDTHYSALEEEKLIRTLLSQSPEGLIITGGNQTTACQALLQKEYVPIVQIMELLSRPLDMNVGFSHWQAGFDVATHLLATGAKRIGFIGARMDSRVMQRLQGFEKALLDAGVLVPELIHISKEPSSIALGGELFKTLMSSVNRDVGAIFCANDDLALGALFESQRMNISVPEQLSLCGFNDIEAAQFVNPSLTSVYVGRYEMGVKAAQMVIERLQGAMIDEPVVDMGYQINQRQSTSLTH
jgi:LacI family transcriptional regulator, gluconate utilization system Gnt-I transcriptional repressor